MTAAQMLQVVGILVAAAAPAVTVWIFRRASERQDEERRSARQQRLQDWQQRHELAQARMEGKLDAIPALVETQLITAIRDHERQCRTDRASDYQRRNTDPGGVQQVGG